MKKIIYKTLCVLGLLNVLSLRAQNYYAKTIEKIGVTNSASDGSKMAASGNSIFVCGAQSTPVDLDPGVQTTTVTGTNYIRRISNTQQLLWAKAFSGYLSINRLILDNNKSIYLVGNYNNTIDVDPGPGVINVANAGSVNTTDGFIIKLDSNGVYQWHQKIGGTGNDVANDIAYDSLTNCVFITGYFNGTFDFDPSATAYNLTATAADMYVWRLNATTGAFFTAWSNSGASDQYGNTIVVDGSSNVIVSGQYYGTPDMDPLATTFTLATASGGDGFVAKFNQIGTLQWAKYFGGATYSTSAFRSTLIPNGDLIIGGNFTDLDIFYNGNFALSNNSLLGTVNDIFYMRIDPSNGNLNNAYVIGGTNQDLLTDLSIDASNNLYISGTALGSCNTNPVGTNNISFSSTYAGCFFTKMLGINVFDYTRTFGGGLSSPQISNLVVNDSNEILLSGTFSWTGNLDPSPGVTQNFYAGSSNTNGFLINYAPCTSTVVTAPTLTNTILAACLNDYFAFTATAPNGAISWYDITNPTTPIANGTSYSTNQPYTSVGIYSYFVVSKNGCGTSTQVPINFEVNQIPNVNIVSSDSSICVGETVTLSGNGAQTYSWSSGQITDSIIVSPSITTSYTLTGTNAGCPSSSAVFTQNVSTCVGLEENLLNNTSISFYPNPANNYLTVKSDNGEKCYYEILNANGELLIRKTELKDSVIDLSSIAAGIYFIKITNGNAYYVGKLNVIH